MPEVIVRPAAPADFVAVANLLTLLGRPGLTPETTDAIKGVYEHHLSCEDSAPQVAEVDGEVVGFISLEFRRRLNRVSLQAWIPDLVVAESHRGLGAGKALLMRAFELARERKCWSVTLESGSHRTVAHQLYMTSGMKNVGSYFLMDL
jgi:GNAT superfamily N-acetyltransferase